MRALGRVILVVSLLGACTAGQSPGDVDAPETTAEQPAGGAAADLRIALEDSLGRTTLLGVEAVRAAALDDPAGDAVARWWEDAAQQVAAAVKTVDPAAADGFLERWDPMADLLLAYAAATDDEDAEALADELDHAATELATAVARTTGEHWDPDDAGEAWREHVEQLGQLAAAYADGDADEAVTGAREEHARMRIVAQHWAEGLAEHLDVPGSAAGGRTELRSAMNQLFGEHSMLLLSTIRHVREDARKADATAAGLNGNTEDLRAAFTAVLDPETGEEFARHWRSHVALLLRRGVSDRRSTQRDVTAELDEPTDALADLFSGAVEGLDRGDVSGALTDLQVAVARHSEAMAAGRYRRAGTQAAAAYDAATDFGETIAAAIADDRPVDFPGG